MLKSSIIFLNGPEGQPKTRLIQELRKKFETSCVMIARKELLNMLCAHELDRTESLEWLVPKILKNTLNNGVFVLFDAFLPTRRAQQYVAQMHGLPCYWIGVFFKEHDSQLYDFTVTIDETEDLESTAYEIYDFVEQNQPRCFEALRSVEFAARKREINFNDGKWRSDSRQRGYGDQGRQPREPLVFASPEEKRQYKENKFRSLKSKYRNPDDIDSSNQELKFNNQKEKQ